VAYSEVIKNKNEDIDEIEKKENQVKMMHYLSEIKRLIHD